MMHCNTFFNFTKNLQKFFKRILCRNSISKNKQKFIQVKTLFLQPIFPTNSINKLFLAINLEV